MLISNCAVRNSNKSRFAKGQKARELLGSASGKVPIVGPGPLLI